LRLLRHRNHESPQDEVLLLGCLQEESISWWQ
jgi:hypothetical protein